MTTNKTITTTHALTPAPPPPPNPMAVMTGEVSRAVSLTTSPIVAEITALTIVTTTDYHSADLLLVRIRQAKKIAEAIFAEKLGDVLESTRNALNGLYAVRREVTEAPFENAEKVIKGKMAEWQAVERKKQDLARAAAQEEERRKEREARKQQEEAERAARSARSEKQREEAKALAERAEAARWEMEEAKEVAKAAEKVKIVTGVGSRVTVTKKAVVTDMTKFVRAVVEGEVPEICLEVNAEVLKQYFENDRGLVSCWPGVELVDVTKVGGR